LSKLEELLSNNIPGIIKGFCLPSRDHFSEIEEGVGTRWEIGI
jgi:hypothetical protein